MKAEEILQEKYLKTGLGGWGLLGTHPLLYILPIVINSKNIVELGTGAGSSTAALICAAKATGGKVHTIDIVDRGAKKLLAEEEADGNVDFIIGDSVKVGGAWKEPVDFLFCDSDHSYSHVKGELETWGRLLTPKAIIGVHDTLTPKFEINDPYRAAEEYSKKVGKRFINLSVPQGLGLIFPRAVDKK